MSKISEIGAAVIGTGFIGTVHVEQLRRIGVQVRGVLGSTPERGAARGTRGRARIVRPSGRFGLIAFAGARRVATAVSRARSPPRG